eukprot:6273397-Prymnesium_polylepis.2
MPVIAFSCAQLTTAAGTPSGRRNSALNRQSSPSSEHMTGRSLSRSARTAASTNGCQKDSAERSVGGRKARAGSAPSAGWLATALTKRLGSASRSQRFHAESCTSSRELVSSNGACSAKRSPTSRTGRKQWTRWLPPTALSGAASPPEVLVSGSASTTVAG